MTIFFKFLPGYSWHVLGCDIGHKTDSWVCRKEKEERTTWRLVEMKAKRRTEGEIRKKDATRHRHRRPCGDQKQPIYLSIYLYLAYSRALSVKLGTLGTQRPLPGAMQPTMGPSSSCSPPPPHVHLLWYLVVVWRCQPQVREWLSLSSTPCSWTTTSSSPLLMVTGCQF